MASSELKDPTSLKCPHQTVYGMTDQPTQCPKCLSRTDFVDVPGKAQGNFSEVDWHQHHKCLNPSCGFEFAVEDYE